LIVYNISSSTATFYEIAKSFYDVNFLASDASSLWIVGDDYTATFKGYLFRTAISDPLANSQIVNSGVAFTPVSTGDYSLYSTTVTGSTPSNVNLIDDTLSVTTDVMSISVTREDVNYYTSDITFSGLSSNIAYSESIYLTCSISGGTPITYSLVQNGGEVIPSWVLLDDVSQTLSFTAPQVNSITTFSFRILSSVNNFIFVTTTVYITIDSNLIQNFSSTANSSSQVSSEMTETTFSLTASFMALSAVSSMVTSMVMQASPQGMWSMFNQMQFYMLIPLITNSVPDEIMEFLKGYSIALFNFDFLPFEKIPGYESAGRVLK
jgi:hypothetical protein